jgi:hypothetical protein
VEDGTASEPPVRESRQNRRTAAKSNVVSLALGGNEIFGDHYKNEHGSGEAER